MALLITELHRHFFLTNMFIYIHTYGTYTHCCYSTPNNLKLLSPLVVAKAHPRHILCSECDIWEYHMTLHAFNHS